MFTGFQFRYPYYLLLLLALVPYGWICLQLIQRRRQQFIELMGMQVTEQAQQLFKYYLLRATLIGCAMLFAIVALARPQWGSYQEVIKSQGLDIIIAVDVSLSMLARDELPSRLARARLLTEDMVERLGENRIGLIGFAGSSVGLMPLTLDKAALKTFIESLDGRAADSPGTSIASAIRRATNSFQKIGKQARVLIVISDGEDQNEDEVGNVKEAINAAIDNGLVILTVGVGSSDGANIPLDEVGGKGLKMDGEGKPVVTMLSEASLQEIAEATNGIYVHTQPNGAEEQALVDYIERLNKGELRGIIMRERQDRFQYFLIMALLLLLSDSLLSRYRP